MAFVVEVSMAFGADLTAAPSSWTWTDITAYVRYQPGITIVRGRADEFATFAACRIELQVDNRDGRFCSKNPTGAYYPNLMRNTPVRVRAKQNPGDTYSTRAVGFVDALPLSWDKSERNSYVTLTASGVLRRLAQTVPQKVLTQTGPIRSSAYRSFALQPYAFTTTAAVAYWPCEDESSATEIASGITGGTPMTVTGTVTLAGDSTLPGSGSLITVPSTATSAIAGVVPGYAISTSWAIRAVMKIPTAPAIAQAILRWHTGGTLTEWQLVLTPGSPATLKLEGYTPALAEQLGDAGVNWVDSTSAELYGTWVYYEANATQNGSNIDWSQTFWFGDTGSGTTGTSASDTIGNVRDIGFGYGWGSAALTDVAIGHIGVSPDTSYPSGVTAGDILDGFSGETASFRFTRLLSQEKISSVVLSGGTTIPLGVQQTTSVTNLLQQLEEAEQGRVYDGRTGYLTLLPHEARQNRTVDLTIDKTLYQLDALGQPTDDDQKLQNDVTASRIGGSSARYADTAHIDAGGGAVYATSVSLNLAYDADLPYHAQWRTNLGTVDDLRYPRIDLNFSRAPSLITSWLTCDIGSRVQVLHPPSTGQPDTIDVHIEGYTETISTREWTVSLNTAPARPWQVFTLEDTSLGRLDTGGSYLLSSYSSSATSMQIATSGYDRNATDPQPAGPQWSTSGSYDLNIAGERVTASFSTNAASFVAAGTAAHADNASVTPALPAGVQQGDLLLVFAANRNTAAVISTPTGYTALMASGNVILLGKIHTGTESAPTITFTGTTAAGDTMSAQMAAFRNTQLVTSYVAGQSNGAAQNIAVPIASPVQPRQIILWLGWKQDDWTSVATLSGATEIGEPATVTGNDQGLVWDYQIQTNPAEVAATSFVVTGGTAQISKGFTIILNGDVQTATVTRAVNGVSKAQTANTAVSLWKPGVLAL